MVNKNVGSLSLSHDLATALVLGGIENPNGKAGFIRVQSKGWTWLLSLGSLFLLGQHH